jgi:hypothetical protein
MKSFAAVQVDQGSFLFSSTSPFVRASYFSPFTFSTFYFPPSLLGELVVLRPKQIPFRHRTPPPIRLLYIKENFAPPVAVSL